MFRECTVVDGVGVFDFLDVFFFFDDRFVSVRVYGRIRVDVDGVLLGFDAKAFVFDRSWNLNEGFDDLVGLHVHGFEQLLSQSPFDLT